MPGVNDGWQLIRATTLILAVMLVGTLG